MCFVKIYKMDQVSPAFHLVAHHYSTMANELHIAIQIIFCRKDVVLEASSVLFFIYQFSNPKVLQGRNFLQSSGTICASSYGQRLSNKTS
jgi:hypothetical protein